MRSRASSDADSRKLHGEINVTSTGPSEAPFGLDPIVATTATAAFGRTTAAAQTSGRTLAKSHSAPASPRTHRRETQHSQLAANGRPSTSRSARDPLSSLRESLCISQGDEQGSPLSNLIHRLPPSTSFETPCATSTRPLSVCNAFCSILLCLGTLLPDHSPFLSAHSCVRSLRHHPRPDSRTRQRLAWLRSALFRDTSFTRLTCVDNVAHPTCHEDATKGRADDLVSHNAEKQTLTTRTVTCSI